MRLSGILTAAALLGGFAMATPATAAIYDYNFGTSTGTYNTAAATVLADPAPPQGSARVRVGTGGGSFTFVNPGSSLGSGSELQCVAPTGTSVNKFSVYDYPADKSFHTRFNLRLQGGSSGTWTFYQGDGASYSDNNNFTGAQVFTGIQWVFGAGGAVTTTIRVGANWVSTGLPATPFAQDTNYYVEIYGNNNTTAQTYRRSGTTYTVDPNQWDLWINGVRTAGLGKGQMANDVSIDSFMFIGVSSTGNVATLIVDDFSYGGDLATVPVSVSAFSID